MELDKPLESGTGNSVNRIKLNITLTKSKPAYIWFAFTHIFSLELGKKYNSAVRQKTLNILCFIYNSG